ncbi:MAG: OmpA family protein [Cyclobacteriaceae bacterium]
MRIRILAVIFLVVTSNATAQLSMLTKNPFELAERYFEEYAFDDAAQYYERAYYKDPTAHIEFRLAETYRLLNDPENSEKWFAKIAPSHDDPLTRYHYAEALKANGKYEESRIWFEKYKQEVDNDERPHRKISALNNLASFQTDSDYFNIALVDFNTDDSDFSPVYYDQGLVFVSARGKRIIETEYKWDGSGFLDLYYVDPKKGEPTTFNAKLKSLKHDGPIVFYNEGSKAILTRNSTISGKKGHSSDGVNKLQLYFFERNSNSEWSNPEPFSYNDPDFNLGHAAIDESGSMLIFASDLPGAIGGSDLFYCKNIDNNWSTPEPMGGSVNTEGDELFPAFDNNTIYFASTGHGGLGGLDIFYFDLGDTEKIVNMGSPINSSVDDFGLIKEGKTGYFSSNRSGNDDIYYFEDNRPNRLSIDGQVLNALTHEPIAQSDVFYAENFLTTDDKGKFNVELSVGEEYVFSADKRHFELVEQIAITPEVGATESIILEMMPINLIARIKVIDSMTGEQLQNTDLQVVEENGRIALETFEEAGYYKVNIQSRLNYSVTAFKREYFTKHQTYTTNMDFGEVEWLLPLEHITLGKEIKLENIYYDLNKATIRSDAISEMNVLVDLMKENPTIHIELSSHTDSRGGDSYNLDLSQRRAESAVRFLIENGINENRMEAKGYGETLLLNNCKNGSQCDESLHQQNRRTEFKVTKY